MVELLVSGIDSTGAGRSQPKLRSPARAYTAPVDLKVANAFFRSALTRRRLRWPDACGLTNERLSLILNYRKAITHKKVDHEQESGGPLADGVATEHKHGKAATYRRC